MQITKRDCTLVDFDKEKIKNAILKAMKYGSGRVEELLAGDISDRINKDIKCLQEVSIYDIEEKVFNYLYEMGHEDTARAYEGYRAIREFQRDVSNTTDESIMQLLGGTN